MNPALIQSLMRNMGVDPDAIVNNVKGIGTAVEKADARLSRIERRQEIMFKMVLEIARMECPHYMCESMEEEFFDEPRVDHVQSIGADG